MKSGVRMVVSLLTMSIGGGFIFLFLLQSQQQQWKTPSLRPDRPTPPNYCSPDDPSHRIDGLIQDAEMRSKFLVNAAPRMDVQTAAMAYRARRGRHPPPGFDVWVEWGRKHDCIIVEEFFDQIHEDLEPFWGMPPSDIRTSVESWPSHILRIRKGKVLKHEKGRFRTRTWAKMLGEISSFLPDLDIAVNPLDEPRIMASKHVVEEMMKEAERQKVRMMDKPISKFHSSFQRQTTKEVRRPQARFDITRVASYHKALNASCRWDDSNTANHPRMEFNVTSEKDVCANPQLLQQHGFLLEPTTIKFTTSLIPVFSATKTSFNNDILLPEPAYYFDEFNLFSDTSVWTKFHKPIPWKNKHHSLIWRGAATGGIPRATTWQKFHRHRFVMAFNDTLQQHPDLQNPSPEWLRQHSDVSFTHLPCDSHTNGAATCSSLSSHFDLAAPMQMSSQYAYKYLPDLDGNSLSGRFRSFMLSSSAPIKATIFKEWHDGRLVPWRHYIPVGMGFGKGEGEGEGGIWEVLGYFLGGGKEGRCGHDGKGERIAKEGQEWARRVLRKEDMLLYVWRVMLEYKRVGEEGRDSLGFVGDLMREG